MKKLEMVKMEMLSGGWTLTCDVSSAFMIWGDWGFFGHFEVSNCYFSV
jgi:hypothetical protein